MINKFIENPNTYDDIVSYVTMLGVCLAIIVIVIVITFIRKKNKK